MKDIIEKLKSMNKEQLSEAMKQAKAFAETPQGKELVEKIKNKDMGTGKSQHAEIMKQLDKNSDIAKTIFDILKG